MKKLACLLLALVMLLSLAACAPASEQTQPADSQTTTSDSNSETASSDGSAHRDTLTVAISREPKSLLPYASNDTGTSYITHQIYDALLSTDADMNLLPGLATEWEQIDDTHYRFKLREGVTFHDGSPFTAEDVLYTFGLNSANEASKSVIGPVDIENSVAEDDHTVVIALSEPYPAFLNICALDLAAIVSKSAMEADPEGYANHPVGTGAFQFDDWATGDHLSFTANKSWWGGEINFDKLVLRYIAEASTRAIEAESGGVDIAHIVVSDASNAESNPDVNLQVSYTLGTQYLSFNCSIEPFNNVKVRQAISLAIDADAINKASQFGYSETPGSFLAPGVWGYYDAESEYEGYNVEKAKELLAEAGYPDGFSCTLISNASQSVAEMIQAYLKEIGIEVTLNVTDFSNWLDAIVNGKQQMYLGGWTVPSADATEAFAAFNSAYIGKGDNRSFYANDDVDALIETINTETDSEKRMQACVDLQKLLADECVTVGLYVGLACYSVNKDISNFVVLPSQSPNFVGITFAN